MATTKTKAELEQELESLHDYLAAYKEQVRETAIAAAKEESWCRPGLNQALAELGLPEVEGKVWVSATLEVKFLVELGDTTDPDDFDAEDYLNHSTTIEIQDYTNTWQLDGVTVINVDQEDYED